MALVDKASWYIESHLAHAISLGDIAAALEVSSFHLARVFGTTTGHPVMRYVWRRRLALAARALTESDATVLNVALDAGYASHEAFTRAFRLEFGLSPLALRRRGSTEALTLTHPLEMRTMMANLLTEPKLEMMEKRVFAGTSQRYTMESRSQIPQQWAAYNGGGVKIAGARPGYYGLAYNFVEKGTFDYLVGQEITGMPDLPAGFAQVSLPAGPYARFATQGHITTISMVWAEVYNDWLSRPAFRPRQGPSVEYYPAAFDAETGNGGFEVWVPVEA